MWGFLFFLQIHITGDEFTRLTPADIIRCLQVQDPLDMTVNEDRSCMRKDHAAENMAALRRVALNPRFKGWWPGEGIF